MSFFVCPLFQFNIGFVNRVPRINLADEKHIFRNNEITILHKKISGGFIIQQFHVDPQWT